MEEDSALEWDGNIGQAAAHLEAEERPPKAAVCPRARRESHGPAGNWSNVKARHDADRRGREPRFAAALRAPGGDKVERVRLRHGVVLPCCRAAASGLLWLHLLEIMACIGLPK